MKTDIEELDQYEPKYLPVDKIKKEYTPLVDKIKALSHVVFLRPDDPWMMADDALVQLPFPPLGQGLSMKVCVLPVVKALGGRFVWNGDREKWDLMRPDPSKDPGDDIPVCSDTDFALHPDLLSMTMTLSDILIPLKMGILLLDNGSVYIGARKQLALIDPPDLDDDYRLILHPFRDEQLFVNDFYTDEWGYKRRRYNRELAIRSLAFSKASYTMHITPFIMDGWLDYTLVYEGKIQARADDWNIEPTGRKVFLSSIKQLLSTQSAKAVVMGRPTSSHTAIVNITFTGTKHAADWLNNFKVSVSNQLHKGFYELASQFDSLVDQIHLTLLARTMGMKDLTLMQVFEEAKRPDSRFKIWVTGHSQGGAMTQVYIAEFLTRYGVLHENIFGYSFASPSVATTKYCEHPGDFPVFNINNADDFACRVGSALRLGMDLMYYPDESFRMENYPHYAEPDIHALYQEILNLCYWMTDSFKFGEFMIAITSFASSTPVAKNFVDWIEETPLLKQIFHALEKTTDLPKTIHHRMFRMLEKPYMDVGGNPPSEERIAQITDYLDILFKKRGMNCFTDYTYTTHQIPRNYSCIVQKSFDEFRRAVWTAQNPACQVTPDGVNLSEEIPFPVIEP